MDDADFVACGMTPASISNLERNVNQTAFFMEAIMSKDSKALAADAIKAGQEVTHQVSEAVKESATKAVGSVKGAATQAQQRAGEQLEEWSDDISQYAGERLQSFEAAVVQQIRQQ